MAPSVLDSIAFNYNNVMYQMFIALQAYDEFGMSKDEVVIVNAMDYGLTSSDLPITIELSYQESEETGDYVTDNEVSFTVSSDELINIDESTQATISNLQGIYDWFVSKSSDFSKIKIQVGDEILSYSSSSSGAGDCNIQLQDGYIMLMLIFSTGMPTMIAINNTLSDTSSIGGGNTPLVKDDIIVILGGMSMGITVEDLPQTIKITYEA